MLKITPDEVKVMSKYVADITGIVLDQNKAYLIENRLGKLAEKLGCSSYSELYYKVKSDASKSIEKKIINAITTRETLFFRDNSPFELLQHKILPDLIDKRSGGSSNSVPIGIRIWSAACSTGQELYSIAITLKELLQDMKGYRIKLFGTDISDDAITQASYGKYNKFEIERGLPKAKLQKYFTPLDNAWRIKDEIRAMASFKKHNLMDSFHSFGKWDIVLCRNVAIYFNLEERKKLFTKISTILEPDGYLIIGASEYLTGVCPIFEPKRYLKSVFYQVKNS
ncbi:MAG: protein-glutamate O-methyltransferase CheR [Thermodesulfobacteriota bacterium]|nr:protein-glutamate O-methyltransferase CheR [Thermodesulfobacteriota bacterium]